MDFKITHYTKDLFEESLAIDLAKSARILGGREAGICYMKDNYFDKGINNTETALKRANNIITKHHSPFDHFTIGIEISGIPKICAMILNSIEFYNTSEKSARYTIMHPETDHELQLYEKWTEKFKELINLTYPNLPSSVNVDKLAIENARYLISVFTPTSMGYTTTYRMYSYMYNWLVDLIENHLKKSDSDFNKKLIAPLSEIKDFFGNLTDGGEIADFKGRKFSFLRKQYYPEDILFVDDPYPDSIIPDSFGDTYTTTYSVSFACLAQLQRHRTINYQMSFDGYKGDKYYAYLPPIMDTSQNITVEKERLIEYSDEYSEDIASIKYCYPQGTFVNVVERGTANDFLMKAKERICGRAQIEVMDITVDTMDEFIHNLENISDPITKADFLKSVEHIKSRDREWFMPASKCKYGSCNEPCAWYQKCTGRII